MSTVKSPRDILTNYYDLLTYVIHGQLGALASDVLHVITLHEPLTLYEIAIKVKEHNATQSKDAFAQKVHAVETNIGTLACARFNQTTSQRNNNNDHKSMERHDDFTNLLTDVAIKEIMTRLLLHRCVSYHNEERIYQINRFASLLLRIAYPLMYHLAYKQFGVIGQTIISNLHQLAVLPFDVLMEIVHKQISVEPSLTDQLHKEKQENHTSYYKGNHDKEFNGYSKTNENEELSIEEVNRVGKQLLEKGWIELLDSTHNVSRNNYTETEGRTTSSSSSSSYKHKRSREDPASLHHSSTDQAHSINLTVPLSTPCQLNVFQIKLIFMEESIVELISEYYERESTQSGLHCAIIRVFFDALRINLKQERQRKRRLEENKKEHEEENNNKYNYADNEYTESLHDNDNTDIDICNDIIEFPVLSIDYIQHSLQSKLGNTSISRVAIYNTLMQLYNTEHNCLQTFHGALEIEKNTNQVVLRKNFFGTEHEGNMVSDPFTENVVDSNINDTNIIGGGSKRGKIKETSNRKSKDHKRVIFQNAQRSLQSNSPQNLMEKEENEKQKRLIGIVRPSVMSQSHDYTSTSHLPVNNNYKNNKNEFEFENEVTANFNNNSNNNNNNNEYYEQNSQWQSQHFTLNAPTIINCLQAQIIERVIFARYGILGIRIAKLLFAQYKWLEDKHIAEETIATLSHVREVLHGMLNDGYCLQQEVPRSANVNERMIRSSVFLWGNESITRMIPFIREHIAKSLHNALVKLNTLTCNAHHGNGTDNSNNRVIPTNVPIRLPEVCKLLETQQNNNNINVNVESKVNRQVMERVIHQQRQVTSLQSCALSLIRMLLIMNL